MISDSQFEFRIFRTVFRLLLGVLLCGSNLAFAEPLAAAKAQLDLATCYKLALERSEQLKIRGADIEIAEAQYKQAVALLYPELNLKLDQRIRDDSDFGQLDSGSITSPEDPTSGSTRRGRTLGKTQFDGYLTVDQPIFNGFRDFLYAEAAQKNTEANKWTRERVRELLYADVAELYYQVLAYQGMLEVLARTESTLNLRIKELKEFIALGKSRDSEVIAASADLADNETLRARTKGLLDASLELLAFLTGVPSAELSLAPLTGGGASRQSRLVAVSTLDSYLVRAKDRYDLKAAQALVESQSVQVTATERQRWPDVSLKGNAYPIEDPDRNRQWELLVQLSLPIFEGGRIKAETAEAQARLRAYEFSQTELARQSERDIRLYFSNVQSLIAEQVSLQKLKLAAEKEYQAQREDYQLGVVTNLEVLTAIQQVQNAERRILESEAGLRAAAAKLEVAAGGVTQ